MFETYQFTSGALGLLVAVLIVWLVRRDHLHGRYAMWWIAIALAFAILGVFPQLVNDVAGSLGIAYPPILVVLAGMAALVVKMVTMDIERTRAQVKLNRLAQRLAMLEADLEKEDRDAAASVPGEETAG